MEALKVKVCVCTHCVLKGAMDIIESIEDINDVKEILEMDRYVKIESVPSISDSNHDAAAPVVVVGDDLIKNATAQEVLEKIFIQTNATNVF